MTCRRTTLTPDNNTLSWCGKGEGGRGARIVGGRKKKGGRVPCITTQRPLLPFILLLFATTAVGANTTTLTTTPRRALRANERFANTLTLAAGIVGPFFDPAGNVLGIAGSAVPALRSAGVPLPGCTACPVSPAAAGPLKFRTRTINNVIIGANDLAQTLQPGGVRGATTRFFRSGGQAAG